MNSYGEHEDPTFFPIFFPLNFDSLYATTCRIFQVFPSCFFRIMGTVVASLLGAFSVRFRFPSFLGILGWKSRCVTYPGRNFKLLELESAFFLAFFPPWRLSLVFLKTPLGSGSGFLRSRIEYLSPPIS